MRSPGYQKLTLLICVFLMISCISEQVDPEDKCPTIIISIIGNEDSQCGEATGAFVLSAEGGQLPYTFESDLGTNDSGSFTGVAAGVYTVSVADANGCSNEVDVSVQNESGLNVDNVITTEAGCGTDQGSIEVEASGGEEPFSYAINGGSAQESNVFSGLGHGSYDVTITDAIGCETSQTVDVLSGVSFENSIRDIIRNDCAISGCHNGSRSPDLRTASAIQSNAKRIKARTANRSMPRGRTLTQNEIDLIACWADDGAPIEPTN